MNNAQTTLKSAVNERPTKRKKAASLDKRKSRAGYFFVLPFILGFVLIYLPIIWDSFKFSLSELKTIPGGGFNTIFVGLENYRFAILDDPKFVTTLIDGIKQLVLDIPAIVIFSLFMAVMLNQKMVGRAAFRAILFVPVILSTGLIESIDNMNTALSDTMESETTTGMNGEAEASGAAEIISAADLSRLFDSMMVGADLVVYVTNLVNDVYNIINRSGVQILTFLAGLQSISPAIYESCSIDGATAWETFWKITFPMISPMILVNTIYTVIDSFTSADNSVMTYIANHYDKSTVQSSAMAWIYFVIVILIVLVVTGIVGAYTFYQRRD
jgi:ABC-type sugar transport system permease subunit